MQELRAAELLAGDDEGDRVVGRADGREVLLDERQRHDDAPRDMIRAIVFDDGVLQLRMNRPVGRNDLASDPAQQGGAGPHQDRQTGEQRHDQRGSGDDQGDADCQTEDQQRNAAIGGGGHRDHIVEAHYDVGDRHDLYRGPQMRRRLHALLVLLFGHQQFRGDHK